MQVELSSGGYHILSSGFVFLFDDSNELTIQLSEADETLCSLSLQFQQDLSKQHRVEQKLTDNKLVLTCFNFNQSGTGLSRPAQLAVVNGKKVYLTFWYYEEGSGERKTRSIKYTLFREP